MSLKDQSKEQKRVGIMTIISVLLLTTFLMAYFFSQNVLLISAVGQITFAFVFASLIYSYKTYQNMWEGKPKEH